MIKKITHTILFLVILSMTTLKAQPYVSCFTTNTIKGCAPLNIVITDCSTIPVGFPLPIYWYDFLNAPATTTTASTFTYNTPGSYTIRQIVNNGIAGTSATQTIITVLTKPVPTFTADICSGGIVKVTITDTQYDTYDINYGDGTTVNVLPSSLNNHTYLTYTPKNIIVTGKYSGGCVGSSSNKVVIPVNALTAPDITNLTMANMNNSAGQCDLRFVTSAAMLYRIEQKLDNGAFGVITNYTATGNTVYNFQHKNINTLDSIHTYRIRTSDVCGNNSSYSTTISSIPFTLVANNGSNQLSWKTIAGHNFTSFEIYRDGSLVQTVGGAVNTYSDNSVVCKTSYCYKIIGVSSAASTFTGTNVKSNSSSLCIQATLVNVIPTVTSFESSINDNKIDLKWSNPLPATVTKYELYQAGNYISDLTTNSYTGNNFDKNSSNCYTIKAKDNCDNKSAVFGKTCPTLLEIQKADEQVILSWNAYTGFAGGIKEYIVEQLDSDNNVIKSSSAGNTLGFTDSPDPGVSKVRYRIKVVPLLNTEAITASYSNIEEVDFTPQIYVPTIFSPNGDGINDFFEVKGKFFNNFKMTIMNKWGEIIFISEDPKKGWDGSYLGKAVADDAFAYIVEAKDSDGKEINKKGILTLVR